MVSGCKKISIVAFKVFEPFLSFAFDLGRMTKKWFQLKVTQGSSLRE